MAEQSRTPRRRTRADAAWKRVLTDLLPDCLAFAAPDLHALVPFNLRPLDQPVPRDLGNRFGLLLLELPVHVRDGRERVRAVQKTMASIKRSHEGLLAYGMLGGLGLTPPLVESRSKNYLTMALEEIAEGKITYDYKR